MTFTLHPASERGISRIAWLDSKHSFNFGDFYHPEREGFGALLVLNDDIIAPGKGFGMHPHDNMEIVTLVLTGELEHKDSMGNKGKISAHNVQRMSAGTGVVHAEMNNSKKPVHLLQIWITPRKNGLKPSYEQHAFVFEKNKLTLIASSEKKPHVAQLGQDATMHYGTFTAKQTTTFKPDKGTYVFLISGEISVNGQKLASGDALAITDEKQIVMKTLKASEVLVIQVPR